MYFWYMNIAETLNFIMLEGHMHYLRLKTAKRKAKKVFDNYHNWFPFKLSKTEKDRFKGIYRKTKVFCSGPCCGNPRKHFNEKTRQEKRADEDFKQQLEDL